MTLRRKAWGGSCIASKRLEWTPSWKSLPFWFFGFSPFTREKWGRKAVMYIIVEPCRILWKISGYCTLALWFQADVALCRLSTMQILSHAVRVFFTGTITIYTFWYRNIISRVSNRAFLAINSDTLLFRKGTLHRDWVGTLQGFVSHGISNRKRFETKYRGKTTRYWSFCIILNGQNALILYQRRNPLHILPQNTWQTLSQKCGTCIVCTASDKL